MSYILDALRKADLERRRGRTPDFMDPHGQPPQKSKKPAWIYLLLLILVAIAGGFGWYFGHDNANQNEVRLKPAPMQIVTDKHAVQQQPLSPAISAAQPQTANANQPIPAVKQITDPGMPSKPASPRPLKEKKPATQRAVSPHEQKVSANRIYSIAELPDSVRQGLPALSISTHIYSPEPSERLVSINGQVGHEGNELLQGIVIDSIVPDGAILKYQGYRFKVGLR